MAYKKEEILKFAGKPAKWYYGFGTPRFGYILGVDHDTLIVVSSYKDMRGARVRHFSLSSLIDIHDEPNLGISLEEAINMLLPHQYEDELLDSLKESNSSTNNSEYNTICSKCGAPAYQGLLSFQCSKGCR